MIRDRSAAPAMQGGGGKGRKTREPRGELMCCCAVSYEKWGKVASVIRPSNWWTGT